MALSALGGWLISASAVVVTGVAGAALALSGVLVPPQVVVEGAGGIVLSTSARACIDGPIRAELFAGDRVLVVAQSADAQWVAVRNPQQLAELVWVPREVIVLDEGEEAAADAVPIGGECATVTIVADAAEPLVDPGDPADPTTSANPAPPTRDTVAPVISSASSQNPDLTCDAYTGGPPTATVITTVAADNVGVTAVTATWSGAYTGQATAARSGGAWTFTFDATGPGTRGAVQFVMTAIDAAGNTSTPAEFEVFVDCLI